MFIHKEFKATAFTYLGVGKRNGERREEREEEEEEGRKFGRKVNRDSEKISPFQRYVTIFYTDWSFLSPTLVF